MIDIDQFTAMCSDIVDDIPPALLRGLNGGVVVSDVVAAPSGPPDTVRLGEYVVDPYLGRYVVIYHQSFCRLYGQYGPGRLRRRLRDTILHEIRHHVESLAGVNDLVAEDIRQLERYWRRWRREGRDDE